VQPHRSGDLQVCIPKWEVSTIKPKKAVGQKSHVGLNGPPQPGNKINTRACNLNNFYPKYHCEINFIKQYWGAAKLRYWVMGHTAMIEEMEKNVIECLDDIPLLQIQQ